MCKREQILVSEQNPYKDKLFHNCWLRYIDDVFTLFSVNEEDLKNMMTWMNTRFKFIKFTCNYDFQDKSVEYLDVKVSIRNTKIITNMYRKPMATNSYLLKSSCHPNHVTNNIPYGLALRIKMICSEQESFEKEVQKLKSMLVKRNYKAKTLN